MMENSSESCVPPGFRFHPTDEELVGYYLKKKVACQKIDLDVIRDIDLYRIEPWDLQERCRIGYEEQSEWYFFSHKDKKYPTGTRTNRATMAGFWKATGRDKAVYDKTKLIGMRKTLVFYKGRAPNGQKTDWIMHEYRLESEENAPPQEEGWVVCRVFKKKNFQRGPKSEIEAKVHEHFHPLKPSGSKQNVENKNNVQMQYDFGFDNSMHLPQLLSPESAVTSFLQPAAISLNNVDIECSQNLMKLGGGSGSGGAGVVPHERFHGDWSFLDKLLASHQNLDQLCHNKWIPSTSQALEMGSFFQKVPFPYLGCEADILKYSK